MSVLRALERVRPWRFAALVALVYLALALVAYAPSWPGDPSRLASCACGDTVQQSWFLGYVPWALLHGHDPFFTTRMYYPAGANLAINTEMPLLGLITAPISLFVSPVASFSLLMYLAYPLSALSMYAVVRAWTSSNVAAAASGLLYGFSAYTVGEGIGHLNLSFVPLPPLLFFAVGELVVFQRGRPARWGVALGVLASAQFLISPEILSTTAIVAVTGLVGLAIVRPRAIGRERVERVARAALPAVAIFVVVCGFPVYMMLAGPQRYHGSVQGIGNPFRADLLGPLVPTTNELVAPHFATSLGDKFAYFPGENGSYLGIPLVLLALWVLVARRRDRQVWLAAFLAVVGFVYSLGPTLMIAAHSTGIPLPFDVIVRLPLLSNILPSRFSLYEVLFVAMLLGLGVAGALAKAPSPAASRLRPAYGAVAILGAASIVALLPRWPQKTYPIAGSQPPFFTSAAVDQLPYDGVVLTYPFAVSPLNLAMLWQEDDRYRFTIVGGYALDPQPNGNVSPWPPQLQPLDVQEFLGYEAMGPNNYLLSSAPAVTNALIVDFRRYVIRNHVSTVVFDPNYGYKPKSVGVVYAVLRRAFGAPSATEGGVDLWFDVPRIATTLGVHS